MNNVITDVSWLTGILVNLGGLIAMVAIVGWFWLWKPKASITSGNSVVDIVVANGVYEPSYLEIKRGATTTLNFHREDPSPCAERVIFHDLNISETLPVGATKSIRITPQQTGSYRFTCQMQMYQGKLQVTD
jgi:plastocyanin domain-containing protein